MIRYPSTSQQIETAVDVLAATWRERATERTKRFVQQGRFEDPSPIWSDIKEVFVRLQHRKCLFCERQFEGPETGKIEYDLEHFRPKSAVKRWPPRGWTTRYDFELGEDSKNGYFWLAYELRNYAASCKVCNSVFKSNYFPVASARCIAPETDTASENAYLCYPIGKSDVDPEKLVTFTATTAIPVARSGAKRRRAEVIIDFFSLNRIDQLHVERARMIALLGGFMEKASDGRDVERNRGLADKCLEPHMPHANCSRAFHRLWQTDEPQAREALSACQDVALASSG